MNTKEMRAALKARVKNVADHQRELRIQKDCNLKEARGISPDTPKRLKLLLEANDTHWERVRNRYDIRALNLVYAFLKGRTYLEAESKCRNEPDHFGYCYITEWEHEAEVDLDAWRKAGDQTIWDQIPRPAVSMLALDHFVDDAA